MCHCAAVCLLQNDSVKQPNADICQDCVIEASCLLTDALQHMQDFEQACSAAAAAAVIKLCVSSDQCGSLRVQ